MATTKNKLKALTPKAAKKKYQKLYTEAQKEYESAQKSMKKGIKTLKSYKNDLKTAKDDEKKSLEVKIKKWTKTVKGRTGKKNTAYKAYSKAKANYKNYGKSKDVAAYHKNNVLAKMRKSKYWGHRAYLIPDKPASNDSYVFIYINDYQPAYANNITTSPVERGRSLATASQTQATSVSVTGILGGDGGKSKMSGLKNQSDRLQRWSDNATDLIYSGDQYHRHVAITNYTPDWNHDPGTGGTNIIAVTLTLTLAEYADSNVQPKKNKTNNTGRTTVKKGTRKKNNGGKGSPNSKRYVITKNGWTYSYISQKTGTSIATLEKKNKYAARSIPTNVKIYY